MNLNVLEYNRRDARVERCIGRTKPGDRRDGSIRTKFSSLGNPEVSFFYHSMSTSPFEVRIIVCC